MQGHYSITQVQSHSNKTDDTCSIGHQAALPAWGLREGWQACSFLLVTFLSGWASTGYKRVRIVHVRAHLGEALGAHHGDVGVGDGQDERGAEGRGRHRAERLLVALEVGQRAGGHQRVRWQEGRQVALRAGI